MSKFNICLNQPNAEALELAEKELRETPQRVKESTEALRKMIDDEPKLCSRSDDEFLKIFLRPCKWYPDSALALMKRVADFRKKHAEVLNNLSFEVERLPFCEYDVMNVLIDRDSKGRRILLCKVGGGSDTKIFTGDIIFRMFYLVHLVAILEPESQIRGAVVIFDFEGMTFKQITQLTPTFSLRLLSFIQDAMPFRLKEVHVIKEPALFSIVWNIFKPLIKEKLRKRLFFHGSKMSSLHNYLDPECLPSNYGGLKPKLDYTSADWYPALISVDDTIREWQTFGWTKE